MAKKGNYVCECGKDCGNPPALELHKKFCKKSNGESGQKKEKCEHEFRLLNPQNQLEYRALQDDYIKVCTKCKELE